MKLGESTIDTVTGVAVVPQTLCVLDSCGLNRRVFCQPKGFNKETGRPLDGLWLTENRLKHGPIEVADLPCELIGEEAECIDTGLKGKIAALMLHYNGCLHADLAPKGTTKDGNLMPETNIDIRRLKGKNIPTYDADGLAESIRKTPSPVACGRPLR